MASHSALNGELKMVAYWQKLTFLFFENIGGYDVATFVARHHTTCSSLRLKNISLKQMTPSIKVNRNQ